MRKVLAVLISFMMVISLMACNGATSKTDTTPPSTQTTQPETTQSSSQPASTAAPEATPAAPAAYVGPLKKGHIAYLNGVESSVGILAKQALEFAVKEMGGQINGRPIEIIEGDSQSTPSVAVDVAKKMVERDKVVAILGPTQIGHKSAVSEYIKTAGIPLIFYNPTPLGLTKSNPWLVGAGGATSQMPSAMGDYVYNEMGYRKVHTLAMDNTGGRSFIDPFVKTFTGLGGTVLQQQWAPVPCPDFSPYLVKLGKADALVSWTSSSDAIALWSAWSDLGLKKNLPIVAAMHGGMTDFFVSLALSKSNPKAAEAMLGSYAPIMYTYDIDNPENKKFVEGWKAAHEGKVPSLNLPGSVYQALLLLKTSVESINGDTAPDKLIKAIFAANINGPEGHLFFEQGSQVATKNVYIVQTVKLEDGSYNYKTVKVYKDVPPAGLTK
jgi:branched-chain amino acid transport system substrate-binding protein